jgi:hypothetical protein
MPLFCDTVGGRYELRGSEYSEELREIMVEERCLTVFLSSSSSFWISAIRLCELALSDRQGVTPAYSPDEKMVL